MNVWRAFQLPLLTKELIEQAQNKRTYIFRVLYAVLLYGAALFMYSDISGAANVGMTNFGRGKALFQMMVIVQAIMIVLLLPPITCGAVTIEKEKDTLALLLLTKLTPATIVFEKLLSRIFAMGTYQLLSLPLFAIIYGMGGVDIQELINAIAGLVSLTIVVSSISILCSTWFRTTSAAFVMTYGLLLFCGFFFVPMFVIEPMLNQSTARFAFRLSDAVFLLVAPVALIGMAVSVSAICLFISGNVLVARAFIPPRNLVLEMFQRADKFFNDLNKQTTGGIVLVPDRESLPAFNSIAWRETRKKSLGTFRYQFRVLMLLLTPLIFSIAYVLTEQRASSGSPFYWYPAFFWIVSIICLTIHSTAAIPSERLRQTLDVLLVMPKTSAEIIREKLAGVRRLTLILSVPFIVLIGFQVIWLEYVMRGLGTFKDAAVYVYLLSTGLPVIIYMPLIKWIGFQLGLRLRTQMQAVLSTFAIVGASCAIPVLLIGVFAYGSLMLNEPWRSNLMKISVPMSAWLSPVYLMFNSHELLHPPFRTYAALLLGFHFAFYTFWWWFLRRNALRNFSRIIGRAEPSASDEPPVEAAEKPVPAAQSR